MGIMSEAAPEVLFPTRWGNAPPCERTAKYKWEDALRELAEKLRRRYPGELATVKPGQIGFMVNLADAPKKGGRGRLACCRRVPGWVQYLTGLTHVIELFKENCKHLQGNQLTLVLYHELRHIGEEGKLRIHDTEEFGEILDTFGHHPFRAMPEGEDVDDILLPDFSWAEIRQPTLFDEADAADEADDESARGPGPDGGPCPDESCHYWDPEDGCTRDPDHPCEGPGPGPEEDDEVPWSDDEAPQPPA